MMKSTGSESANLFEYYIKNRKYLYFTFNFDNGSNNIPIDGKL